MIYFNANCNFIIQNFLFLFLFSGALHKSYCIKNGQAPQFIREPPGHVNFINNSSLTVHCMVSGQPTPTINWYQKKINSPILVTKQQNTHSVFKASLSDSESLYQKQQPLVEQRSDGSLYFSSFPAELYGQEVHKATYFCEASNIFGILRSKDVNVQALISQNHRAEVFDEYIVPGNNALFKCNLPTALKDFVYVSRWIIDQNETITRNSFNYGDRYTVFSNGELYVRQITEKDISRTFACETRNRLTGETAFSVTKGRLYLTPTQNKLAPRVIYSQNIIRVDEGERVMLPCIAQGYPIPSFNWYQVYKNQLDWQQSTSSSNIQNDQTISINFNSRITQLDGILIFKQALLSDNGRYRCIVNNSLGTSFAETELIVSSPLFAEIIPNEITADVGSSVHFNCSYSGYPVTSIEWFHNSKPIFYMSNRVRLINKHTLVISKVQRQDKGVYQCLIRNEKDNLQAHSILDLGDDAPTFLETFPSSQTVDSSTSVSLKCIATGNPLPQVTWTLDGYQIPDDNKYRIGDYVTSGGLLVSYVNITSSQNDHGGHYECTASNEIGTVRHQGELNIYGPAIIRPMGNTTVIGGEKLFLHCPVGGYPIQSIYWEKDNWKVPFNHRQKAFPNGTLVINQVERDHDEGQYTCFAKGKQGPVSKSTMYITVLVRPVIDEFMFPKTLHEGQRYNILCTVIKGDAPVEIQWLKDGVKLFSNSQSSLSKFNLNEITISQVTEFSAMLNFASLRSEHRGNYTCQATNIAGSFNHTATMIIQVPPTWKIEPADTTVVSSIDRTIDCQATGFPPPRILWSKAEEFSQDASSDFKAINSSPHVRVFENGSLTIHNTQKTDSGFFLCQANNGVGPGLSKVIKLSVHVAANFKVKFKAETVQKGSNTRLRCEAFGDSPITINWTKDKLLLNVKDDSRYELIENSNTESFASELIIQDSNRRDSSLFTCIASNSYGEDQTSIQLILQEPPDSPNSEVIEIEGKSAKLIWKTPFTGNLNIIQYLIEYQIAEENWNKNTLISLNVSGTENSVTLKNLKPVTQYQVRIFAQNSLGKSESPEQIIFKTDEEIPSGPPTNIKCTPVSSNSIKISWRPPKKENQNGVIIGYHLGIRLQQTSSSLSQTTDNFDFKTINTKTTENFFEFLFKDLKKSSTYSFIIQAINSKGAGVVSEQVLAQTHENDPPKAPVLKVISSSSSTIQITWHIPSEISNFKNNNLNDQSKIENNQLQQANTNDSNTLPVIAFVLNFKVQNTDAAQWQELRLPGDRSSFLFEHLRCGSKYQFYIYAINSIDKGDSSEIITFKTEGMTPVAPDKNSLLIVNSTAVSIYLDSWHNGGCSISKFEIMYKMQRSKKWINLPMTENDVDFRRVFITSLKSSTNYDLVITAINEAGPTQAQYSFTTFALIKETAINHILANNEASSSSSEDVYMNVGFILPTCISMLIILLVVLLLCVLVVKKKNNSTSVYGLGIYDTSKCQSNIDTLRLSDLDNSNLKKVAGVIDNSSGLDSGYYPSPYAMTKLNNKNLSEACLNNLENLNELPCGLNENQINSKLLEQMLNDATNGFISKNSPKKILTEGEPLYATVKRTPRALRTDLHVYQCPGTLKNSIIDSQINNSENLNNYTTNLITNHSNFEALCTNPNNLVNPVINNQLKTSNYIDQISNTILQLENDCEDSTLTDDTFQHCQHQYEDQRQQNLIQQNFHNILTHQRRLNKHFR